MINKKVLIVAADYYEEITTNLIEGAEKIFKEADIIVEITKTKGSFEIPFLINKNLEIYDGFVALGCIIRGETYHFELIANEVSRKIMDLSIQSNKPIGFGIITCENMQQAKARSNKIETWSNIKESFGKAKKTNKGIEAAVAVVNNIHW